MKGIEKYITNNFLRSKWIKGSIVKKKHTLAEWIIYIYIYILYCLQRTHFRSNHTYTLKMKGMEEEVVYANGGKKIAGIAIL